MVSSLLTLLRGFAMGCADVVPGVSGGTVAYIVGIYPRLLAAINSIGPTTVGQLFRGHWRQLWRDTDGGFLLALGCGIIAAVLFFTRVVSIPALLVSHPQQIYGLFFGLIVGSLLLLSRELGHHRLIDILWMGLGTLLGLALVNLVPTATPHTSLFVFLSGAVAITAMLLPGISGSFILLILHQYEYIFGAIGALRVAVIAPFAAGCLLGILLFSRLLAWLLSRFGRQTRLIINGLLLGSLWAIWPFQHRQFRLVREKSRIISSQPAWPADYDESALMAFGLIVVGLVLVMALGRVSRAQVR